MKTLKNRISSKQKSPLEVHAGMMLIFWAVVLLVFYFIFGVDSVPIVSVLMIIAGMGWINNYHRRKPDALDLSNLTKEQKEALRKDLQTKMQQKNAGKN